MALRKAFGRQRRVLALAAAAGAAVAAVGHTPGARTAVYVFDPAMSNTGGTDGPGVWDTTTTDWFNTSSAAPSAFGNTTADTAVFGSGGTGGTVTVANVVAGATAFNNSGYALTGGTITLADPSTITAAAGVTASIASVLAGSPTSTVVSYNGAGTVAVYGANTYTGQTNITGGILSISSIANGLTASPLLRPATPRPT